MRKVATIVILLWLEWSAPASQEVTVYSADPAPPAAAETGEPESLATFEFEDKTYERVALTDVKGEIVTISHAFGVKDLSLKALSADQIEALNKTSNKIKIPLPTPEISPPSTNEVEVATVLTDGPVTATNQVVDIEAPPAEPTPSPPPAPEEKSSLQREIEDLRTEAESYRSEVEALKTEGANPLALNELLNKAKRLDARAAELEKQEVRAAPRVSVPTGSDPAKIMAAEFQQLARDDSPEGRQESRSSGVPWYARLSAWAGFFTGGFGLLWLCGAAIHYNDSLVWALLIFFLSPLAAIIYFILNFRNVWLPFAVYAVGFFMLAIPKVVYNMGFLELLM